MLRVFGCLKELISLSLIFALIKNKRNNISVDLTAKFYLIRFNRRPHSINLFIQSKVQKLISCINNSSDGMNLVQVEEFLNVGDKKKFFKCDDQRVCEICEKGATQFCGFCLGTYCEKCSKLSQYSLVGKQKWQSVTCNRCHLELCKIQLNCFSEIEKKLLFIFQEIKDYRNTGQTLEKNKARAEVAKIVAKADSALRQSKIFMNLEKWSILLFL
jgi:hypothetical protein